MRELNQRTSEVVRAVAATRRPVAITSSGEATGVQLVPVERGPQILEQLVASGRAVAPSLATTVVAPVAHGEAVVDVAAAMAAERETERW